MAGTNFSNSVPQSAINNDPSQSFKALPDLNRKSLLFEIVSKTTNKSIASFILIIPPDSIDVEEAQRVTYTKTWAGIFIDDYGPDNVKIQISGNTGSSVLRRTYAMDKSDTFNGKTAFYYFRDQLMRYKDKRNDYENYTIFIYDLSTVANSDLYRSQITAEQVDGYEVSLTKFKMTRSKDRPLFYNYQIELLAVRKFGTFASSAPSPIQNEAPDNLIIQLQKGLNTIKNFLLKINAVYTEINNAIQVVNDLETAIVTYYSNAANIVVYPLTLAQNALGVIKGAFDALQNIEDTTIETIYSAPPEDFMNMLDIFHQCIATLNQIISVGKTPIYSSTKKIDQVSTPSNTTSLIRNYQNLSLTDSEIPSNSLSSNVNDSTILTIYGYINIIADSGTTLLSLSSEYFGSPDYMDIIAIQNNLEGDTDIIPGMTIQIPVIALGNTVQNNYIFDSTFTDVYGHDVKLDSDGNMIIAASGDISVIESYDNLIQALNLRLNEQLGSRLRLTVYGIKAQLGGSGKDTIPIGYILASIKDTIIQDPRVRDITDLRIWANGDALYISFTIIPIKINDVIKFSGGIN